ncbi:MAG: type VII toxin-antitoxin system MntA family adenylyltransferase antitoxin [Candidatus Sericytochromatia bacterium]
MNEVTLVERVRQAIPGVWAIYAFGSRVHGTADASSDLDLAVLAAGPLDPLALWELAGKLPDLVGCEVDLLDFRAASTVMQHQILMTGRRVWVGDERQAGIYESFVLSAKTALDEARAGLVEDIQREGRIYGR